MRDRETHHPEGNDTPVGFGSRDFLEGTAGASHFIGRRNDRDGPAVEIWCPSEDETMMVTRPALLNNCPMCGDNI